MNYRHLIPHKIKMTARYIISIIMRLYNRNGEFERYAKSNRIVLSDANNPTFFGYHDKSPFSRSGSKILAMSIMASDTKPESECTPMKLGYFQKSESGVFMNVFVPFAETSIWCFQQGCMLQWHPLNSNSQVLFNTLVDNAYGSVLFDIENNMVIKEYRNPIYSLDPTGKIAASLNFSRLGRLRPGYGYGLLPDPSRSDPAPADDGVFSFDLVTGKERLLVSLASLAKEMECRESQHYVNHITFAPDGKRIVFFHVWSKEVSQGHSIRMCTVEPDTGVWREVESERTVSHYCWRDPDTILATNRDTNNKWRYSLYDLKNPKRTDLAIPLDCDGHPMFHPLDKCTIITDTYPDLRRDQYVYSINLGTNKLSVLSLFYSPVRYSRQVRCDLHPRWDREGKYFVVDSTALGKRKVIVTHYNGAE